MRAAEFKSTDLEPLGTKFETTVTSRVLGVERANRCQMLEKGETLLQDSHIVTYSATTNFFVTTFAETQCEGRLRVWKPNRVQGSERATGCQQTPRLTTSTRPAQNRPRSEASQQPCVNVNDLSTNN